MSQKAQNAASKRHGMSIIDLIFGKPVATSESKKEELSVWTGVPVLGLDALASAGYGPEAALTVLSVAGANGLHSYFVIVVLIVAELGMLYLSYRQTAEAYPGGGGAYNVAKDNFGSQAALWAAVALLLDYTLNVAVGISAGIGVVVSALPSLQPRTLALCLLVLFTLMVVNLRGVRESGMVFVVPVLIFVVCLTITLGVGLVRAWASGGHPDPVVAPPPVPPATVGVSAWLLLTAFANGCTAMTGIEAVSNGVPLFRQPKVPNAHRTLTAIMLILSLFLLALGYLCPVYHIGAMNELQPGYRNVLSQLVAAVAGRNIFYYVSLTSIFIVLTYSAQTSFADFPRVCRFLAEDCFLPRAFAERGRRLVFSHGIVILTFLSALLLILFGGITDKLIPLFAVGAFGAFLFSQAGMVRHWLRKRGPGFQLHLVINGIGAAATAVALAILVLVKFKEGAWMIVAIAPVLVLLLRRTKRHYRKIGSQAGQTVELQVCKLQAPAVIIPINGWNRVVERALRFGMMLSDDITALHVCTERDDVARLRELWRENVLKPTRRAGAPLPKLEIIESPYRQVNQPIVDFVAKIRTQNPERFVAVIIPALVERPWFRYLLHNIRVAKLRTQLFLRRDERTITISTPWGIFRTGRVELPHVPARAEIRTPSFGPKKQPTAPLKTSCWGGDGLSFYSRIKELSGAAGLPLTGAVTLSWTFSVRVLLVFALLAF